MPTTAELLQTLVDIKAGLKTALEKQSKEPTDAFSTYAGLIDGLENPDKVEYFVTCDGTIKKYAQLVGEEKVELTATANDVREGTSVIVDSGYLEGEKYIPSYHSRYGKKAVTSGSEAIITGDETDYEQIMVSIAPFNSSLDESVAVMYVSVDNAMYEVNTGNKISDITKDVNNEQVNLGIVVDELSILRFFLVREEV